MNIQQAYIILIRAVGKKLENLTGEKKLTHSVQYILGSCCTVVLFN